MAKTQEELTQLKNEYEALNNKLQKRTDDELKQVIGGTKERLNFIDKLRENSDGRIVYEM